MNCVLEFLSIEHPFFVGSNTFSVLHPHWTFFLFIFSKGVDAEQDFAIGRDNLKFTHEIVVDSKLYNMVELWIGGSNIKAIHVQIVALVMKSPDNWVSMRSTDW